MEMSTAEVKQMENNTVQEVKHIKNNPVQEEEEKQKSQQSIKINNVLKWNNLGYSIINAKTKQSVVLLEKLYGKVSAGEVCAVIGPSGAGKSTFLDSVAGRKKEITGNVLFNDQRVNIKNVSTYVMQDDSLMGNLTVYENILFSAELQMNIPFAEKKARTEKIIKDFGLEKIKHSKIGSPFVRGISGGQRRRVSIATQVITEPPIIFLDEPTSGLDSAASYHIMKLVQELAKKENLIVIVTIHQPNLETFNLFSKVLVLGQGRTLYFGDQSQISEHFSQQNVLIGENPADYIMQHINVDFIEDREVADKRIKSLSDSWESKEERENLEEIEIHNAKPQYANTLCKQTEILTRRIALNARRNPLMFWIRFAMYLAMAVLVATSWLNVGQSQNAVQNRFSVLFLSVAFLSFMAVAGIPGFLEERFVFVREHSNGTYAVGPFVVANTLVLIPFMFINAFAFALIVYWAIGLNPGGPEFGKFLAFLYLALLAAEGMVLLISSVVPIFVAALSITAFANGLFMVTQGFFLRASDINSGWKWAHYINYQKFAFEALAYNDLTGLNFDCQRLSPSECFCKFTSSLLPEQCQFTGTDVLTDYGYEDTPLGLWALYLILIFIVFRIGFYLALRLRKHTE